MSDTPRRIPFADLTPAQQQARTAAINRVLAAHGFGAPRGAVTTRRIVAASSTLADLTTEDHPELDPALRDDIARVRDALDRILTRKGARK